MSEAKRALMEVGHAALARSGSGGPIIALHSSTAFSLSRMSIIQGPLVEHTHPEEQCLYQSFLINHLASSLHTALAVLDALYIIVFFFYAFQLLCNNQEKGLFRAEQS